MAKETNRDRVNAILVILLLCYGMIQAEVLPILYLPPYGVARAQNYVTVVAVCYTYISQKLRLKMG